MEDEDANDELNRKLYIAMMNRDKEEVIKICKNIPEGPLHIMTIHDDTVLQMASYDRQADLVLKLLEDLPEAHLSRLIHQNDTGNTILHEAATSDSTLPAAKEMMAEAPRLLSSTNNHGETPIFRAARYGKTKIFNFLAGDVDKICGNNLERYLAYFQRTDKTTILHISVLTENFGELLVSSFVQQCRIANIHVKLVCLANIMHIYFCNFFYLPIHLKLQSYSSFCYKK